MLEQDVTQDFDALMRDAQIKHAQGNYPDAVSAWQTARSLAPTPTDEGRALRGEGVSEWRWGDNPERGLE